MGELIVKVKGLGKRYHVGAKNEAQDSLIRGCKKMLMEPWRWLNGNDEENKEWQELWALKDVSFEVDRGERVGIVGHNGAGKTTLLKILSGITGPTQGYVEIYGRPGALLTVGAGMHPELTGRENVYLSGAVLGMKRSEISEKMDEIIEFAELEEFIDTPVKFYSSGMYARLAFSVGIYFEPEVFLLDEVLAVGDVHFVEKCLTKIHYSFDYKDRTILFVSHSLGSIREICPRTILLDRGCLIADGPTEEVLRIYAGITA